MQPPKDEIACVDPGFVALGSRYTATCRLDPVGSNYLAIGYHEPVTGVDRRGDPFNIDGPLVMGDFGLHIFDFNLP